MPKKLLQARGVKLIDIAELVMFLQKPFKKTLTIKECMESVESVLKKLEVYHAIMTGIALDQLAEKNLLSEPLLSTIKNDASLFGVDEILSFSIINLYGSIGFTNFGYIDKVKPGILKKLNRKSSGQVNTFLDDIVGAIAAAAASRIAHRG